MHTAARSSPAETTPSGRGGGLRAVGPGEEAAAPQRLGGSTGFAHDDPGGGLGGADLDGDGPLRLPEPPAPARRGGVPLLAATVPMAAAVGLWLATGTTAMLWFAALGPLIAVAGLADSARAARRHRRRERARGADIRARASDAVAAAHERERRTRWQRHPDVARAVLGAAGDGGLWRAAPDDRLRVVVGSGAAPSRMRVTGGGAGDAALRHRAAVLEGAPITVPLDGGVAVVGPDGLTAAVMRALVLQVCLAVPPDRLAVLPPAEREAWCGHMPHVGAHRATAGVRVLAVCAPGERADRAADVVFARVRLGAATPPRCRTVVTLTGVDTAHVTGDDVDADVRIEAVSGGQALHIATMLRARARDVLGVDDAPDDPVALRDLLAPDRAPGGHGAGDDGSLTAVIGVRRHTPFLLDLVADGPHAVIAGMTGSGKSELLTTWITAMCARHPPARLAFLLADFKGGTAFDALTGLPHVTGVITDLDGDGARRALHSLRAELRHREARIVASGGHDVADTDLPRLVIVVDEFAALAAAHPDLPQLFVDIAARGRALGMHVVLGTQRAAGTFPDSLLANCPLRISLRVADPADSRIMIGGDDAARLPGGEAARGLAVVRRAADVTPHVVRVALCDAHTVADTVAASPRALAHRPWLSPLSTTVSVAEVRERAGAGLARGDVLLGLADEPELQRQSAMLLRTGERGLCAVGQPGSGRTTLVDLAASQALRPVRIGPDPEQAWDALTSLADEPEPGATILIDDVDALLGRYPADYAQEAVTRLERVVHGAAGAGARIVMTAQRVSAATARLIDLVPRRAVLATPSRAEHVAAGGDPQDWHERMPPGRAVLGGHLVQFAIPDGPVPAPATTPRGWAPAPGVTGVVLRPGPLHRRVIAAAHRVRARVVTVDDAGAILEERAGRPPRRADRPVVAIGDVDRWQREWRTLAAVRDHHVLLFDAAGAAEYRLLTGSRDLPPYCLPGRGRGWLVRPGRAPVRAVVPAAEEPR